MKNFHIGLRQSSTPNRTAYLNTNISNPDSTMIPNLTTTARRHLRIFARSLALLAMVLSAHASLIYTDFDIPSGSTNVGIFTLSTTSLSSLSQLSSPGVRTRGYAYRSFKPSVTGNYTLGMTDASYDPVMILYSGLTFNPSSPSTGAMALNDDGAWTYTGGNYSFGSRTVNPSAAGGSPDYMPLLLNQSLTSGADYLVVITTYGVSGSVPLPANFFLAGPGAAGLDGAAAAPPAPTSAIWNTASGNWTTTSQWDASTPPVDGVAVEFSGSGGTSTNDFVSGNLSAISGLTFTSSANGSYTINGNALAIGADGIVNNSTSTQTVAIGVTLNASQTFAANTANLVVSGNISGTGNLTKSGNQTLTLSGSNTYNGSTTISSGTLVLASGGSISHSLTGFHVGGAGENAVVILNGGSISNFDGYIGFGNGSTGTVNMNSGNWTNGENLRVGYYGNGTLNLTGGSISNVNGVIGRYGASNGMANVSGGTWSSSYQSPLKNRLYMRFIFYDLCVA
jgi:autotransporter-associated beta strand protein/T5SS/PEP-CTERM-associated repeat protein